MNRLLIFFLPLFLPLSYGKAQERCGSVEYMRRQQASDPSIREKLERLEHETAVWIAGHPQRSGQRTVIRIPVVVHILYNAAEQNITDAQVQSQIDVLNEDYRRTNANMNQTPSIFLPVATDCEIEFCLARQDPEGNPTNGITRTQTQATVFQLGENMKRSITGGKEAWPTDRYLNIWVCNLTSGLLGFASRPGTSIPAYDGVVIGWKHFGRGGSAVSPYNLGRTATHEVGHWLNLIHIWGDDEGCAGSDEVGDTPNQAGSNQGCPDFPSPSCDNSSDMFMNYMDYTRDACMNLFTQGQKHRMQATLNGFRSGILSSNGCEEPPIIPECDTLNNITGPDGLVLMRISEVLPDENGYLAGHNSHHNKSYAERYAVAEEKAVAGILFDFAVAEPGSPENTITAKIWDSDGPLGSPGSVLAEKTAVISDIAQHISNFEYTEIAFDEPVAINSPFYAGFEISYASGDSVAIYSTQIDEENTGTAWLQDSSNEWQAFLDEVVYDAALSLAIKPVICSTLNTPGVSDNVLSLTVYPNPANEIVYVVNNNSIRKPVRWQLLSADGRMIAGGKDAGHLLSIPLHTCADGLYLVRIESGNYHAVQRVVVQR